MCKWLCPKPTWNWPEITRIYVTILKPGGAPAGRGRVPGSDEKEKNWEERYHAERRSRLMSEAQLRQSVERPTAESKAAAAASAVSGMVPLDGSGAASPQTAM